jgi:hypothetical protein
VVIALIEFALLVLVLGALVVGGWALWAALRRTSGEPTALPARERTELATAIARARWTPAHDEVDGSTRVLVRRAYTGLDGRPVVLEERVLETFPAQDPAWEVRFTEAMAKARFRCSYLNTEEGA